MNQAVSYWFAVSQPPHFPGLRARPHSRHLASTLATVFLCANQIKIIALPLASATSDIEHSQVKTRTRVSSDVGTDGGRVTQFEWSRIAASRTPYASTLTTGELEDRVGRDIDRQLYLLNDAVRATHGRKKTPLPIDTVRVEGKGMYSACACACASGCLCMRTCVRASCPQCLATIV